VRAFEASTPFEKLPGNESWTALNLHRTHFPQFRVLALFGRLPPQRVYSLVVPAYETCTEASIEQDLRLALAKPFSYDPRDPARRCILSVTSTRAEGEAGALLQTLA
jgi:hypothetical protein